MLSDVILDTLRADHIKDSIKELKKVSKTQQSMFDNAQKEVETLRRKVKVPLILSLALILALTVRP